MSSGSCDPSASMNTVTSVVTRGIATRSASPLPLRLSVSTIAPAAAASRAVPSCECPSTTMTSRRVLTTAGDHIRNRRRLVQCRDDDRYVGSCVHGASGLASRCARGAACHRTGRRRFPRIEGYASHAVQHCGQSPCPDLRLARARVAAVPDRRERHAGVAQAADRTVVADAGVYRAPGIDEAAGTERVAGHRRVTRRQVLVEMPEILVFEPAARSDRHAREVPGIAAARGEQRSRQGRRPAFTSLP